MQCELFDRLGAVWEELFSGAGFIPGKAPSETPKNLPFTISKGYRPGSPKKGEDGHEAISYFGHVAMLSNMIADLCEEGTYEGLAEVRPFLCHPSSLPPPLLPSLLPLTSFLPSFLSLPLPLPPSSSSLPLSLPPPLLLLLPPPSYPRPSLPLIPANPT
jgi:hypothetical protein